MLHLAFSYSFKRATKRLSRRWHLSRKDRGSWVVDHSSPMWVYWWPILWRAFSRPVKIDASVSGTLELNFVRELYNKFSFFDYRPSQNLSLVKTELRKEHSTLGIFSDLTCPYLRLMLCRKLMPWVKESSWVDIVLSSLRRSSKWLIV